MLSPDLYRLSLEDLFAQEVSSVAKRPQSVRDAAAAVFVVTREDIRRSGATNIPDVLRMVPGLEVAALPGREAAVTARGFNGEIATKLLILIDGRLMYDSTLGTVSWSNELVPVEIIERIEVVRGPGATLYGANAVNGVINIVTEHAIDAHGASVSYERGSDNSARVGLVQGMAFGAGLLRVAGSYVAQNGRVLSSQGPAADKFTGGRLDFRYDLEPTDFDAITVQGDFTVRETRTEMLSGDAQRSSLLARWTRTPEAGRRTALQAYLLAGRNEAGGARYEGRALDFDLSQQFPLGSHDLIYGLNYRRKELNSERDLLGLPRIRENWFGGYVQDEFRLAADRLKVSLGVKLEHNPMTGLETQPSLRAIWSAANGWSAWGALSRAVRTPSNFETDVRRQASRSQPLTVLPGRVSPEVLVAAEAGWRGPMTERASVDIALYHHRFEDLIGTRIRPETLAGRPGLVARPGNVGSAHAYGFEAAVDVQLAAWWTMKAGGSLQRIKVDAEPMATFGLFAPASARSPCAQVSLRSYMTLRDGLDLDLWIRRVGALSGGGAPAYTDLDIRAAWRVTPNLELVLKGDNLVEAERVEFSGRVLNHALVERRAIVSLAWRR